MLAAENLGISYGPRRLFGEVNFTIRAGERFSLAGPNGSGKSTLMKIIAGLEQQDAGRIVKARSIEIGYLPQEGVQIKGRTLFAEAETAFAAALDIQQQLADASDALGVCEPGTPEYDDALEVFGDLQLRVEHHDVAKMKPQIERVLTGLGFSHNDMQRLTDEFSGGWQMRIALAKLLLQEPSVLLLDEPTNHLDIETVVWLEDYLKGYPGAILIISHDRRLLDNLTNRTLAFEHGDVNLYQGNYSFYVRESKARKEQLTRAAANQQREIAKTQQFIDRFRAKATKATLVQSRIKQLEKIERIELEDEDDEIGFSFPQPPPSGQSVVRLEGLAKSYDGVRYILKPFDFEISKGDRIAIVGVNGAGKTTFSKILADEEDPTDGTRTYGYHVKMAYYSQDHADALDRGRTVLETIEKSAKGLSESQQRTLLGCFLFRGDDVFKSVKILSGGERGRLALANMLLQPANFLVLDEPTNHLDMRSQAVLQQALEAYQGTYVIVSHNRDFLDPIVNKTLEFRVGQPPRLYNGNLSYYLQKKADDEAREKAQAAPPPSQSQGSAATKQTVSRPVAAAAAAAEEPVNAKERRRLDAQRRQERARMLKPLQEELAVVEAEMAKIEAEKSALNSRMNSAGFGTDAGEVRTVTERFAWVENEQERVFGRWAAISEEIEQMKGE